MTINTKQLRDHIIIPSCMAMNMNTPAAVNLLLGTAAQESQMGSYIVQKNMGLDGGLGIFQMEAPTYHDVWLRAIEADPRRKAILRLYLNYESKPLAKRLISDMMLACVMARLHYYLVKEALPDANDVEGLANYWKKYYNSMVGRGTTKQFIENYNLYVLNK